MCSAREQKAKNTVNLKGYLERAQQYWAAKINEAERTLLAGSQLRAKFIFFYKSNVFFLQLRKQKKNATEITSFSLPSTYFIEKPEEFPTLKILPTIGDKTSSKGLNSVQSRYKNKKYKGN